MTLRLRRALPIAGLLAFAACYDPDITPNGLRCAPSGKQCPDGFTCSNGRCIVTPSSMCVNEIPKLCESPISGECDPVCQVGCVCGLRCNVVGAQPECLQPASAPKALGEKCNPMADDCQPGYVCLQEGCGTNLGRCYRHCRSNADCGSASTCTERIESGQSTVPHKACSPPFQTCDPFDNTGCPDPALRCFVIGTLQICNCPSTATPRQVGEACLFPEECGPGLACISGFCERLCRSSQDCAGCSTLTTGIGYCPR